MHYESLNIELRNLVAIITLNRPKAFNALSDHLMNELSTALDDLENNTNIHAIVLTGGDKVFAAGADIKEMKNYSYMDVYKGNFITRNWERVSYCRKPIIAAVAGYALGGGCELAMMCDFIIAADNAKFGQPEVKLGIIPGAGGTQRLTRLIGKSKAMDLCLTGRFMDAVEAERAGLVSRVVPVSELIKEAVHAAELIAAQSLPIVMMAKECINRALESSLSEGLLFERRTFHAVFATEDQKEGMNAFLNKRQPILKHC